MSKIGILGDKESVIGYRAIGLTAAFCDDREAALSALREMAESDYAIIFIIEETARMIPEEIQKYADTGIPAIIPIPGSKGSTGLGRELLSKAVEKAVGSNILDNQ